MPNEETTFMNGAEIDTRPNEEKAKDYQFKEMVVSALPVYWVEKKKWRTFPVFNQDGSGSCVAQTMAKLLGILYWLRNNVYVHFSATHIYQRRTNKPDGGMNGVNAFEIAKQGVTLEILVPSQGMNDMKMDSVKIEEYKEEVGKIFKIDNFVQLPVGDFETVASTIQTTNKGVMVWFYFTSKEWSSEFPEIKDKGLTVKTGLRHSVTAVDYGLIKGKKYIKIEDSSHFGGFSTRWISEEFFNARNWFSAYPIDFKFEEADTDEVLDFMFSQPIQFLDNPSISSSEKRRLEVQQRIETVRVQTYLQQRGFFPKNVQATGYYGAITAKAVLEWQIANEVDTLDTLKQLKGWYWGKKSIEAVNQNK